MCVFYYIIYGFVVVIGYLNMGGDWRLSYKKVSYHTHKTRNILSISDITFTNQCRKYHGKCSIIPTFVGISQQMVYYSYICRNIMANGPLFLDL